MSYLVHVIPRLRKMTFPSGGSILSSRCGYGRLPYIYFMSQHRTMTLYDSRGTHHVIKCTRPSPSGYPRVIITREHAQGTRREKRPGNEAMTSHTAPPPAVALLLRSRVAALDPVCGNGHIFYSTRPLLT